MRQLFAPFSALCQFRICKVISEKNNTLMDRTLPNKCTKFGAKITRSYWVITFLVLGHFLSLTLYRQQRPIKTATHTQKHRTQKQRQKENKKLSMHYTTGCGFKNSLVSHSKATFVALLGLCRISRAILIV